MLHLMIKDIFTQKKLLTLPQFFIAVFPDDWKKHFWLQSYYDFNI